MTLAIIAGPQAQAVPRIKKGSFVRTTDPSPTSTSIISANGTHLSASPAQAVSSAAASFPSSVSLTFRSDNPQGVTVSVRDGGGTFKAGDLEVKLNGSTTGGGTPLGGFGDNFQPLPTMNTDIWKSGLLSGEKTMSVYLDVQAKNLRTYASGPYATSLVFTLTED